MAKIAKINKIRFSKLQRSVEKRENQTKPENQANGERRRDLVDPIGINIINMSK
jgi:hypothetical protein